MVDPTIRREGERALEGLIDPDILSGDPARCTTEFSKLVVDLCVRMEDDFYVQKVTEQDLDHVLQHPESQIIDKDLVRSHFITAGYLYQDLVQVLQKRHHDSLDLPHPDTARTRGFFHDFNKMFSNFSVGEQQSKELDLYFLAQMNGWQRMATTMAFHNDYIGIARLLANGYSFPVKDKAYLGMRGVLQGDGALSYQEIVKKFDAFLGGKDNLPLLVLSVVDNIESGCRRFTYDTIDHDFEERGGDIKRRSYDQPLSSSGKPTLFGKALVEYGGLERMRMYKEVVKTLFSGNSDEIEQLKNTTTFFRKV